MIAAPCNLPDRPPAVVRAGVPAMPPMAEVQGIYGVVRVRVALDTTGAVTDVVVAQSPSQVLIKASVRAARETTYRPARQRCKNVASTYEFRVLYDPNGPRASPPPAPSPTPSSTPAPMPDLARPWRLVWSTDVSYSSVDLTLGSSGSFRRVYDTFPLSHRKECRGRLSAAALKRVVASLGAAHPERWHGSFPLTANPMPTPTPDPRATLVPEVDVVAVASDGGSRIQIMDAAQGTITLQASGITYSLGYEYGESERIHETLPPEVGGLTRALLTAMAACPTER